MVGAVRILGLDPGLRNTGWGIIDVQGNRLCYVAHGVVRSDSKDDLAPRLSQLYQGLLKIIETYSPHEAAVEETFVNKNPASTLKLGMARGIVLLAPAQPLGVGVVASHHLRLGGGGGATCGSIRVLFDCACAFYYYSCTRNVALV